MFTDARKIQLMEELLKITDNDVLVELEAVLKKKRKSGKPKINSAKAFSGIWTKKEATLIEKAIENGCEQINPDDWK